jgi:hypothetical protein
MKRASVRKTISLPSDLARAVERQAKSEGKSLSGVVQEALRVARRQRLREEYQGVQGYWGRRARELGVVTEADLERYLQT